MVKKEDTHHLIEALEGVNQILCALDNIYPSNQEIQLTYHCLSGNLEKLKMKTQTVKHKVNQ